MFSPQQMKAAEEALQAFISGSHWIILLAMMQSGKTETFLLIACDMLRLGLVDNIVIFSGNPECELKEQLLQVIEDREDDENETFWDKYLTKISDENQEFKNFSSLNKLKRQLLEKINVLWGNEINRKETPKNNTLFIWEESHYAQSKKQNPDKFFNKLGLSANGNGYGFIDRKNYMCSVSATPFSERADNYLFSQGKTIIKMEPGDNYYGVKDIRDNGKLLGFNSFNYLDKLNNALTKAYDFPNPKYCIIRVTKKNEEHIKTIISRHPVWDFVFYDKLEVTNENKNGKNIWEQMAKGIIPNKNIAILIRGLCRMGKKLNKKNLSFVFETSKNPKTDTILQGLLGRVCGYSQYASDVEVFISDKVINSGEINRYIKDWDNNTEQNNSIIPRRGMNLREHKIHINKPIIPIKFIRTNLSNQRKDILSEVFYLLKNEETSKIQNHNSIINYEEVKTKFLKAFKEQPNNIAISYCSNNKKTRNAEKFKTLVDAFENNIARDFGAGVGNAEDELTIWIPKNDIHFPENEIYITSKVKIENDISSNIPETTGNEIFRYQLENDNIILHNGVLPITLPIESSNDINIMKKWIEDCVKLSLELNTPHIITSLKDSKTNVDIGINVNNDVLDALNKNGIIYNSIKDKHNLKLKITKTRGIQSKKIKQLGLTRLASIEW
jgi:hypothetical protein